MTGSHLIRGGGGGGGGGGLTNRKVPTTKKDVSCLTQVEAGFGGAWCLATSGRGAL